MDQSLLGFELPSTSVEGCCGSSSLTGIEVLVAGAASQEVGRVEESFGSMWSSY
jgi:hypothetical protein